MAADLQPSLVPLLITSTFVGPIGAVMDRPRTMPRIIVLMDSFLLCPDQPVGGRQGRAREGGSWKEPRGMPVGAPVPA